MILSSSSLASFVSLQPQFPFPCLRLCGCQGIFCRKLLNKALLIRRSDTLEGFPGTGTSGVITVRFVGDAADPGLFGDVLMELGALSVTVEDAERDTENEIPLFHQPVSSGSGSSAEWERRIGGQPAEFWGHSSLTALFPAAWDIAETVASVQMILQLAEPPVYVIGDVPLEDWVKAVQATWQPINLPGLRIRFPWHDDEEASPPPSAAVATGGLVASAGAEDTAQLVLQGGSAFGTGEHPTTSLCCGWLHRVLTGASDCESDGGAVQATSSGGGRVLDYGSGSGVLALAALRFGAAEAVGVEIDRDAIATAMRNAAANGLERRVSWLFPREIPATTAAVAAAGSEAMTGAFGDGAVDSEGAHADGAVPSAFAVELLPALPPTGGSTAASVPALEAAATLRSPAVTELDPPQLPQLFDVTVANILAGCLMQLRPALAALTAGGGRIGLSGILTYQADEVIAAYAADFEDLVVEEESQGWVLITGRRRLGRI